jgi:protein-tyrosine phosphatase
MPQRVLFLCTGNYYRSRFAEILFNTLASRWNLNWSAFSRALAIERGSCNVGPISQHTRAACKARGMMIPEPTPFPCGARSEDFAAADKVIALKEAEHRAYMEQRFPQWLHRVEFWHVHDLDAAAPQDACAQIERHVTELIGQLQRSDQRDATSTFPSRS